MDEDVFVVIVNEEENDNIEALEGSDDITNTKCLLDMITGQEQDVNLKEENEDNQIEYLYADEDIEECNEFITFIDSDDDFVVREDNLNFGKHRLKMRRPSEQISYVDSLREIYPDEQELINVLVDAMRSIKPPEPPRDYYTLEGIMLKCLFCEALSTTIPAAGRHYQEKHGPRYLVCFACGVDFRSTTNLYKHEKKCVAADAPIMLKARAIYLGSKGRGRPFLRNHDGKLREFHCNECPSTFNTKASLKAHQCHHRGETPYRCSICPNAYTSASALYRHMKIHSDVQFICDHCGRIFKVKAGLSAHMNTHLPMRKYGCEECGKRYAQKFALQLHVDAKHRNLPPPCACQICPKRYPRMSLLKEHMRKAHQMEIMTRKMFFKSLPMLSKTNFKHAKVVMKSDIDGEYILRQNTSHDVTNQHDNCNADVNVAIENNEKISEAPLVSKLDDCYYDDYFKFFFDKNIKKEFNKNVKKEFNKNIKKEFKIEFICEKYQEKVNDDIGEKVKEDGVNRILNQCVQNEFIETNKQGLLNGIQTVIEVKRNDEVELLTREAPKDNGDENDSNVVVIQNDDIVMKDNEAKKMGLLVDLNQRLDQKTQVKMEIDTKTIKDEGRKRRHKPKKIISM